MTRRTRTRGKILLLFSVSLCLCGSGTAAEPARVVSLGADGKLVYARDDRGNRVPDFSHCGYSGGGVPIPLVPVRVYVRPQRGENGLRIQAALDHVAALKPDANGLRGAVLLLAGRHEVATRLRLAASGVVLRGQGQGPGGTVLVATGTDRRTLIEIRGRNDRKIDSDMVYPVVEKYVPVGAAHLRLSTAKGLKVGDRVLVEHPSTKEWISAEGMDRFPTDSKGSWLDWRAGTLDLRWDRVITKVDGDTIRLDAPLTTALDAAHGGGKVYRYSWPGRIAHVGVENLRCVSAHDPKNPHDEEHAWGAVGIESAENVWVRQVTAAHFAGSVVSVAETARGVTVEDCEAVAPVSEMGGYRRHTFYTSGQQTLFRKCKSESGRHDFAVGYLAAGPNAFVACEASSAHQFSGPIESWASGVLYDNVNVDGAGLALTNRESDGHGVGWAAANSVLWNCTAAVITCRRPPTAQNWAIGCWGQFVGDGHWQAMNEFVKPESLYAAQLRERLGGERTPPPTPPRSGEGSRKVFLPLSASGRGPGGGVLPPPTKPLALENGWLVCDGKLLTGRRVGTAWWRGQVLPARATEVGLGVTRFVPGRIGPGFTDDLDELTSSMQANHQAVLLHHWGLWYDRRRDDHQMIRRADGEVWPPFYELPWARSGQGKAWDGLSKYDLTKFNPWYFARLKEFAELCDRKGLVLVQQMYFQHNILEAGAHWADFPWRPANCLQATGFAEPPPYVNRKRIFFAEAFYDLKNPLRRQLHRAYIRQCLDVLGSNSNVVFQTGEEFTGPLAFMQFWLDTVAEWEKEKGKKVLLGLSCTKDVQDAILTDPVRGPRVSVIDLKYWWYTANGGLYDPRGGESLAPRQQLREWKGSKSRSDEFLVRQVREYRVRYPDKAVLCSLEPANGWAVVAAGGSVPNLPPRTDPRLLAALTKLKPLEARSLTRQQHALAEPGRNYLVHSLAGEAIRLDLSGAAGVYTPYWIDFRSGQLREAAPRPIPGGGPVEVRVPGSGPALLWLTRQSEGR